jgi:hypothetical protein
MTKSLFVKACPTETTEALLGCIFTEEDERLVAVPTTQESRRCVDLI